MTYVLIMVNLAMNSNFIWIFQIIKKLFEFYKIHFLNLNNKVIN
jgi:hypothetical protein